MTSSACEKLQDRPELELYHKMTARCIKFILEDRDDSQIFAGSEGGSQRQTAEGFGPP